MRLSVFLFTSVLVLLSCDFSVESKAKKHETAEELHASGKKVQHKNKDVSDGIAAFDAYRKAKANNGSWNGPIPTLKPLATDYNYFSEDRGERAPSNKGETYDLDEQKEGTEHGADGDKDVEGDGNRTASFEKFKESESPFYDEVFMVDETKGGENDETNKSFEEMR